MTTLATLAGLLPLAFGIGAGAELRRPLATAVIGGLLTSTLATLGVLPPFAALAWRSKRSIVTTAQPQGLSPANTPRSNSVLWAPPPPPRRQPKPNHREHAGPLRRARPHRTPARSAAAVHTQTAGSRRIAAARPRARTRAAISTPAPAPRIAAASSSPERHRSVLVHGASSRDRRNAEHQRPSNDRGCAAGTQRHDAPPVRNACAHL